jgi:predicted nucleic acid-binding protein
MFLKHLDQGWSFTDCVSFHVMQELGLGDALTKDEHFQRAGFKALLRQGIGG